MLIDRKDAGKGDPGVDIGHLPVEMAVRYGPEAATHMLDGWQRESGHQATKPAHRDAVAALQSSTELDDWDPASTGMAGR